ncbi:phiSA1p31-related protein [Streptomyces niveus]|uniref:phiSA1p31-related protein n=1 Tax=Streptomyces niveus TaxID=193462 RepID=UPI003868938E
MFNVDDKVTHRTFGAGVIAFGPFDHYNGPDHYLLRNEDGKTSLVIGDALTKSGAFKVGDKIRTSGEDFTVKAGPFSGKTWTWYAVTSAEGIDYQSNEEYMRLVESAPTNDIFIHEGVTYECGVRYIDSDGDVWVFAAATRGREPASAYGSYTSGKSLSYVVSSYGPLVKRTD